MVGVLLAQLRFDLLEDRVVLAYASLVPSLLIVTWSMRLAVRRTLWVFLTGLLLTSAVVMRNPLHNALWGTVFALLAISPVLRSIEPFVFLLLPLVLLVFAVGILVDRTHPEIIINAKATLAAARGSPSSRRRRVMPFAGPLSCVFVRCTSSAHLHTGANCTLARDG